MHWPLQLLLPGSSPPNVYRPRPLMSTRMPLRWRIGGNSDVAGLGVVAGVGLLVADAGAGATAAVAVEAPASRSIRESEYLVMAKPASVDGATPRRDCPSYAGESRTGCRLSVFAARPARPDPAPVRCGSSAARRAATGRLRGRGRVRPAGSRRRSIRRRTG